MLNIKKIEFQASDSFDIQDVIATALKESIKLGIAVTVHHNNSSYIVDAPQVITAIVSEGIGRDIEAPQPLRGYRRRRGPRNFDAAQAALPPVDLEEVRDELHLPPPQFDEGEAQAKYGVTPEDQREFERVQRGDREPRTRRKDGQDTEAKEEGQESEGKEPQRADAGTDAAVPGNGGVAESETPPSDTAAE